MKIPVIALICSSLYS